MTDNNNNNNIDNNNEILFWKVIHNKYIFKQIFNQIETNEWVKYNEISDYHINNRMKFKNITSLHWMIKNEQFSLLKCKLENGEDIDIDNDGIQLLFTVRNYNEFSDQEEKDNYISDQIKQIGYYKSGDEKNIIQKRKFEIENKETHQNNLKQVVELLVKHKRDQLVKFDILSMLFSPQGKRKGKEIQLDIEMVKLLFNGSDLLPVTDKSLQFAIQNSTISVLEILINSPTTKISNHIKNNSISWAFSNSTNKLEMIEFILNNNQLYNIPKSSQPSTSSSTLNEASTKRFKNSDGISIALNPHEMNDDDEIVKIKYTKAITISSSNLLERLYKSNYLQDDIGMGQKFDRVGFIYSFNGNENINQFKDVLKHYSIVNPILYSCYLNIYDEMIDGCDSQKVYEYAIIKQSGKALKYLIKLKDSKNNYVRVKTPIDFKNEFIKYYSIGYEIFKDNNINTGIFNFINSIKSESEYQDAYNSISNDSVLKDLFPSKWFDMNRLELNKSPISSLPNIIIKDTETIDLIADNIDAIKCRFGKEYKEKFYFSNYQLTKYAIDKYPNIILSENEYQIGAFEYPFTLAIYNCDLDQIKQIDQIIQSKHSNQKIEVFSIKVDPTNLHGDDNVWCVPRNEDDSHIISFNFKNQPISNVIKMIEYFNSTGYQYFQSELFAELIECIGATPSIDLAKLKLDFRNFQDAAIQLFVDSIREKISLNVVQLILNGYNLFKTKDGLIFDKWDENEETEEYEIQDFQYYDHGDEMFKKLGYSTLFYRASKETDYGNSEYELYDNDDENIQVIHCITNDSIQDIQSIIKILLAQLSMEKKNSAKLIKTISGMVNLLFKRLIKIGNISFEQVDSMRQLILKEWFSATNKSFKFQHSLYHIFYYLGIKSLKLIRLITTHPSIVSVLVENQTYCSEDFFSTEDDEDDENDENVLKYVSPKKYTYEYIFNSSFNTVLEKLIQDIIHSLKPKFLIDHEKALNTLLIYFIEIREFDLFFKHLEIIKKQLQKEKGSEFNFSNELVSSTCIIFDDQMFQNFSQFNSYKSIKKSLLSHKNDKLLSKKHNQYILNIISDQYKINDFSFKCPTKD